MPKNILKKELENLIDEGYSLYRTLEEYKADHTYYAISEFLDDIKLRIEYVSWQKSFTDFIKNKGFKHQTSPLLYEEDNTIIWPEISNSNNMSISDQADRSKKILQLLNNQIDSLVRINATQKNKIGLKIIARKERNKVSFDKERGIITYKQVRHSFHDGEAGDEFRLRVFKYLWDRKCIIRKRISEVKGESITNPRLARITEFITDELTYNRNLNKRNSFINIKKSLNRIFKEKGFPMRIKGEKNSMLLILIYSE